MFFFLPKKQIFFRSGGKDINTKKSLLALKRLKENYLPLLCFIKSLSLSVPPSTK